MDRRQFLIMGSSTAVLGAAGSLLSGCSSGGGASSKGSGAAGKGATDVGFQVVWLTNFEYVGDFLASSRGYFAKEGLNVDIRPGGPSVIVEPLLVSKKALVGETAPQDTAQAIAQGADLKIIGALYQKNPFAVISLASRPMHEPKDLIGKRIAVSTGQRVAWQTFLQVNGIKQSQVTTVPRQSDPTPLVSGTVDGWLGYVNDDAIAIQESGHPVSSLLLADHGYTGLSHTYAVRTSSLNDEKERALVTAFMKADIRGWQDAIKDPAAGAKLAVDKYGKGLKLKLDEQVKSAQATNPLIVSDATKQHGIMWMTDELIADTVETLKKGGVTAQASSFTNEILRDVYKGTNHA